MSDDWPDNDALQQLVKESHEHQRSWALVRGLSNRLLEERGQGPKERPVFVSRKIQGERPEGYADKMRGLEEKIVKQKRHLQAIEEARAFELESEQLLVAALRRISDTQPYSFEREPLIDIADAALREYKQRQGPREESPAQ